MVFFRVRHNCGCSPNNREILLVLFLKFSVAAQAAAGIAAPGAGHAVGAMVLAGFFLILGTVDETIWGFFKPQAVFKDKLLLFGCVFLALAVRLAVICHGYRTCLF